VRRGSRGATKERYADGGRKRSRRRASSARVGEVEYRGRARVITIERGGMQGRM